MLVVVFLSFVTVFAVWFKGNDPEIIVEPEIQIPKSPNVGDYTLSYKTYDEITSLVRRWEIDSPKLIESGVYGKTTEGKDCFYFKISNENKVHSKSVMITASIHGNEPWSTSTTMAYAGWLLSEYGSNERITRIIDSTEIYFVPVVSPDSYPFSRRVDGVDPNRDFPSLKNPNKKSVSPVQNLRDLFLEIKPNSVLSGHTYGRLFLVPWGEVKSQNPNFEDYERIAKEMSSLSGYRWMKASQLYGTPIIGAETDWYHRNGAFAMVIEFGTHQRKPSESDTEKEFEMTKDSFLFFLEESVRVKIK